MSLETWIEYIKTNLYSEHNGFFELPYLSNNPQLMVESIAEIPTSQHCVQEQVISTNNPYTQGVMYYRELEEGLWILGTHIEVKKNIISRALYDTDKVSDYYFLSFAVFEYKFPVNDSFTSFGTLVSTTCTFYRPLTAVTTYFYENTKGKFFNIIFNKAWATKNLVFNTVAKKTAMEQILSPGTCFLNWTEMVPDAVHISEILWKGLQPADNGNFKSSVLAKQTKSIISGFFENIYEEKRFDSYVPLSNADYGKVASAEKIILHNLASPFVGVEFIARSVNISPTKLKIIFKSVFGFSMLQYHKEKNMLLAMQLVIDTGMQIKNIALVTGFESSSKFIAAFKKRFNNLPLSFRKN